jgi:hypothetical protein
MAFRMNCRCSPGFRSPSCVGESTKEAALGSATKRNTIRRLAPDGQAARPRCSSQLRRLVGRAGMNCSGGYSARSWGLLAVSALGAHGLANVSARNGPAPTTAPTSESLSQPRARQLSCLFHCELHPPSSQVEKLLAIQRILGVFSQPYILAGECSVVLRWQRRRHGGGSHSPRQQCWAIRGVPFVPGSR